jgi:predicted transcriptional regulator
MTTTLEPETDMDTTELEEDTEVGTDLALIEDEEVVEPKALTAAKAKQLDKRIRTKGEKLDTDADDYINLLEEAALGQIHLALDEYRSWTAYVADVAKDNRFLQMLVKDKLQRKALAVKMSGTGMSQHAIASALGVSQKTIDRDLDGEEFDSDTITSTDNRTLPRNGSDAAPEDDNIIEGEIVDEEPEPNTRRPSVMKDFEQEVINLQNAMTEMEDVIQDDRFPKQRKKIATAHLNSLQEIRTALETIIDEVFGA